MNRARALKNLLVDSRLRRGLIVAGVCGVLTTLPLVGSLGYENGFLLAPLFSLLAMAVGIDAVRRARKEPQAGRSLAALGASGAKELAALHGLAIAVLLAGQLWQRGCDPLGGLLFYVMGPVLSSVMGWVCGLWAGVLARRRWRQLALALIPFALSVAVGLWRLFVDPVVYAYDPFFGFFSGSIYDESISVDWRYFTYRGYNLLGATTLLAGWALFAQPGASDRGSDLRQPPRSAKTIALATITLVAGLATASVGLRATAYRFTADAQSLTEVLSGTYETEHFVIHYAPRTADARMIETFAVEHEFAWSRLESIMGRAPDRKVHSFVFANAEQKRALMGAGRVQVAAPWRYQIYLDHRGYPHPVLHHELAHVFGATIGDSLLGVSRDGLKLNIGLIEGLATALAPRAHGHLDLHDQAKILGELGHRPPMASIMGPGFFGLSSRVAYTTAGSFVKWLIDTRGFEPMAVLYRAAGDFEEAYGTSVQTLEAEWLTFLESYEGITEEDVAEQAQRFQRPSVWQRPCAHKVAEIGAEIRRAVARGRFDEAVTHRREMCALEPENPSHWLGLASQLGEAGAYDEAREVLDETTERDDLTVTIQSVVHERRGDVELALGQLTRAEQAYRAALELPNHEDRRRLLQLKLTSAQDPHLAPIMVRYLSLFDTESDAVSQAVGRLHEATRIAAMPQYATLGAYLWALQLMAIQEPDVAIPLLEEALQRPDELPSADFVRAAAEAAMSAYVQTGRYDRAREVLAAARSAPEVSNGHRTEYELWEQRIDFYQRYAPSGPSSRPG